MQQVQAPAIKIPSDTFDVFIAQNAGARCLHYVFRLTYQLVHKNSWLETSYLVALFLRSACPCNCSEPTLAGSSGEIWRRNNLIKKTQVLLDDLAEEEGKAWLENPNLQLFLGSG